MGHEGGEPLRKLYLENASWLLHVAFLNTKGMSQCTNRREVRSFPGGFCSWCEGRLPLVLEASCEVWNYCWSGETSSGGPCGPCVWGGDRISALCFPSVMGERVGMTVISSVPRTDPGEHSAF